MQATTQMSTKPRSSVHPRSVTQLYTAFEAAHAVFFALNRQYVAAPADTFDRAWHRRFESSMGRCSRIGRQLVGTPATSIAEIKLKLRTTAWLHCDSDYEALEDLDHQMPGAIEETEAAAVLASVQADLVRIAGTN